MRRFSFIVTATRPIAGTAKVRSLQLYNTIIHLVADRDMVRW